MKKNVLITGITGQDGTFLTKQLLDTDSYNIIGTSRDKNHEEFYQRLKYLKLNSEKLINLKITTGDLLNKKDKIESEIKNVKFDYVYNLMGPGSVYESVIEPFNSSYTIVSSFQNLLNAFLETKQSPIFFQTSSSEMFGSIDQKPLEESTLFNPVSPYANSKYYIHKMLSFYRVRYDWNLSSGILFNHESEFRPDGYLIMKIINTAISIKNKKQKLLEVGSLDLIRDWGYAKDYTLAMQMILEKKPGEDFVIGSGVGTSIKEIVDYVFSYFKLDYRQFVTVNTKLLRSGEPDKIVSNPVKIYEEIGWKATTKLEEIIEKCISYKINTMG
tara:strand:- start:3083 stop:4069 length:987 start_codon:yes stop_codon:yes gene_type:complete